MLLWPEPGQAGFNGAFQNSPSGDHSVTECQRLATGRGLSRPYRRVSGKLPEPAVTRFHGGGCRLTSDCNPIYCDIANVGPVRTAFCAGLIAARHCRSDRPVTLSLRSQGQPVILLSLHAHHQASLAQPLIHIRAGTACSVGWHPSHAHRGSAAPLPHSLAADYTASHTSTYLLTLWHWHRHLQADHVTEGSKHLPPF